MYVHVIMYIYAIRIYVSSINNILFIHMGVYVCMQYVYVQIYKLCVCIYIYICMYVCICICICICIPSPKGWGVRG